MKVLLVLLALSAPSFGFHVEKVADPSPFPASHEGFLEMAQKAAIHLNHSELVFGGQPAQLGYFPYEGFLTYKSSDGQSYICGASLVTKTHVITAAHCAASLVSGQLLFGSVQMYQKGPNSQTRHITNKVVHPQYVDGDPRVHNDIAVLEFSPAVSINKDVQLVKIPVDDAPVLSVGKAFVSGFGTYTYQGNQPVTSQYMRYAEVDLVKKAVCRQKWGAGSDILDSQICAGSAGRGVGPGDSGGPIQVKYNGQLYQVGLSSFVYSDLNVMQHGQDRIPNVFTRASSFCTFISQSTHGGFRCVDVKGGGGGGGGGSGNCPPARK
ncbi:hypothetical protein QR680_013563 [Steinernema hermaphroditum]|uniref:Peptidase S1 domain-containing protein n=1 Tax=Steinernema hermaphroditum TaxID=289476 RepID=A0AA39I8R6_9BILA|nr:hypothetical protein QR680_013563 [Steinernema hermaphroditum]